MIPRKAEAVELAPDASLSHAFLAVTEECIHHWRANVDGVVEERDPEALHQLRVGVRRFRSALSLFGKVLDDPQVRWLSDEIRSAAVPLGVARDLDVFLDSDLVHGLPDEQQAALREQREAAYDDAIAMLTSQRWADVWGLVERFRSRAPWGLDPDPPAREVAARILERRWKRLLKRGAKIRKLSPPERHRVRIAGKKLRYGAQFFAGLFEGAAGSSPDEFADRFGELQDSLGLLNDAHTHDALLQSIGAPIPEVDEEPLIDDAVARMEDVAELEPFWR